ncbi:autotransporter outer membrane beta-barrel domain-containing protein [Flavobacterium lacus]|uniref:TMF family protein n=1 Tax=Flavobacterium lacus TaxID=1353778 RepID=A0A328WWH4_9FLAO|nr:hypothetical protein [Flavobacterium lacus]RAR47199.1 hypothetical protein B0I10_111109 [Flavobacterium lacus]
MKSKSYLVLFFCIFLNYNYGQNTTYGVNANPNNYGQLNTAFGRSALFSTNNDSNENVAVGDSALHKNSSGFYNIGIGVNCLFSNTTGSRNVSLGRNSLKDNNVGDGNVSIGDNTMQFNLNGGYNVAIGSQALRENNSGETNVAVGKYSLYSNRGTDNIAIGHRSFSGIGTNNQKISPTHQNNGSNNIGIGSQSLNLLTSGSFNVSFGSRAFNNLDNGSNNVALGCKSAENFISGNNNVFIGSVQVDPNQTTFSNRIIIATGGANNGGFGAQRIYIDGNGYTGISLGNHQIPQNRLEIGAGGISNTAGLRFRMINSNSTPRPTNGRVLTVNENGDVILTTDQGSGGSTLIINGLNTEVTGTGVVSSPYQINAENIYTHDGTLSSNRIVTMDNNFMIFNTGGNTTTTGGRIYIGNSTAFTTGVAGTNFPIFEGIDPANTRDFRLYVEGGVLTERIKVALRSTANWADYVFADDYQLKSLKEVEAYIKAHKHLPSIESAQELVENGLDLAEMQAKQMGKIEELTLYIIEQDKKLEQQSKDIEELKALVKVLMDKK